MRSLRTTNRLFVVCKSPAERFLCAHFHVYNAFGETYLLCPGGYVKCFVTFRIRIATCVCVCVLSQTSSPRCCMQSAVCIRILLEYSTVVCRLHTLDIFTTSEPEADARLSSIRRVSDPVVHIAISYARSARSKYKKNIEHTVQRTIKTLPAELLARNQTCEYDLSKLAVGILF